MHPDKKRTHTIIVRLDEFPQTGETEVTGTQITKESIARAPEPPSPVPPVPSVPRMATPLLASDSTGCSRLASRFCEWTRTVRLASFAQRVRAIRSHCM